MENGLNLAALAFIGFLLIEVALTGKLGSMLGAIIDPANMTGGG